jgi:selenocysteine lyase/cysteine desulfurase
MIYADWIASGRLYQPIERKMAEVVGPYVGNTHSESSETGVMMTKAYHYAQKLIKQHVNAGKEDVIITTGSGMTSAIVKFQRILGLKVCGRTPAPGCLTGKQRPVVFVSHMEHHSNHTSWFETMAEVVQLEPGPDNLIDPENLRRKIAEYSDRTLKIGSFTACSNVTGIETPYHELARIMHEHGGVCFVDFAASAPYVKIDMHPADPLERLDAIFFSPHKFLGGPGSPGVLVFHSSLYPRHAPDQPGGGTVWWTNAWGEYRYIDDIEAREDGGTPGFLQVMRAAFAIRLKEEMGVENIRKREEEIVELMFAELATVPGLVNLASETKKRMAVFSFYIKPIHYNLIVKLLNDRFGIQTRGGCACAGTYGHFLLDFSYEQSRVMSDHIEKGDQSLKPGWVRISLHPTTTDAEIRTLGYALREIVQHYREWEKDYAYNKRTNEFRNIHDSGKSRCESWFDDTFSRG